MMRLFTINALMATLLLFGASTASAVQVFMGTPSKTSITVGETFTIQYRINTQGATDITSIFTSVYADPSVLAFVSGSSPGLALYNTSNGEALSRASQPVPVSNPADPAPLGAVHAGNFVTINPVGTGLASASQLLATLVFVGVGPGTVSISAEPVSGDDLTRSQLSVIGSVTSVGSAAITVVPEPGTALLMGLGLAGLGLAGRRTA